MALHQQVDRSRHADCAEKEKQDQMTLFQLSAQFQFSATRSNWELRTGTENCFQLSTPHQRCVHNVRNGQRQQKLQPKSISWS